MPYGRLALTWLLIIAVLTVQLNHCGVTATPEAPGGRCNVRSTAPMISKYLMDALDGCGENIYPA